MVAERGVLGQTKMIQTEKFRLKRVSNLDYDMLFEPTSSDNEEKE